MWAWLPAVVVVAAETADIVSIAMPTVNGDTSYRLWHKKYPHPRIFFAVFSATA